MNLRALKVHDTSVETSMAVIEDKIEDKSRREEALEQYREKAGF